MPGEEAIEEKGICISTLLAIKMIWYDARYAYITKTISSNMKVYYMKKDVKESKSRTSDQ